MDMYKIIKKIKDSESILIISHRSPDSDAMGSSLAMFLYLKSIGKNPTLFNIGPVPTYFDFLPSVDEVKVDEKILNNTFDLVIALDLAGIGNSGVDEKIFTNNYLINIDHHISNDLYGAINLVDIKASSTCEVVYDILSKIDFEIDKKIATCLLCGILGDTGNFSNSATSETAITISAELIKRGAKIHKIDDLINKNKSINGLHLWGQVLSRLKSDQNSDIAYTYIKDEEYQQYNVETEELDGLTNFLNIISNAKFVALFRIGPVSTRVGMRTTRNDVDLSKIAKSHGGGGHKKAAGFTIFGAVDETSDLVSLLNNIKN